MLFNNGTLWCNQKTFTKYSQGDAVSRQYIYFNYISSNKKFILRAHGLNAAFSLQSVEQSIICDINTNFIYIIQESAN